LITGQFHKTFLAYFMPLSPYCLNFWLRLCRWGHKYYAQKKFYEIDTRGMYYKTFYDHNLQMFIIR